jgi:hypothetical protein
MRRWALHWDVHLELQAPMASGGEASWGGGDARHFVARQAR